MSRPLPPGDPAQLGPFRLSARLSETPAGIVFLGVDGEGRRASVAVLNRGAAGDAAARGRFRAAINAAVPGPGGPPGPPGPPGRPGPVGGRAAGGAAPVVAAQPDGPAPWVATAYEAERAGAERFLEPVLLEGSFRGRWGRRGPGFQPYWLGSGEPALDRPQERPAAQPGLAGERPPERNMVAAVLSLAAALLVLALLMGVLFACQPEVKEPPPLPPEPTPTAQVPSPSQGPSSPRPSPSPPPVTPSDPVSPGPTPPGGGGDDGGPV
ncbi:hypothetical protein AGRA3207_000413 [Actinomadura graeca]|uniref:Uncharacterized protein n=1 Tax=Actinomadura graeca TaxID=2750812 RepID=A0ABX8QMG2_9ACTN|nr:hypothetical protein [Actinomadura graeca]QXJ19817.1 hypothetical protein AGRA3207_000413 [Actinomadura graeca]